MDAIADTRGWIERFVIGLGLCPFAEPPFAAGRVRLVESEARTEAALLADLERELTLVAGAPSETVETTLLIHPFALEDFDAFNQFLDLADLAVARAGLVGVIQIASFHPQYRFAGAGADDVANATNRSPHPMLHLLREASVERALAACGNGEKIAEHNVALLRRLGRDAVSRRAAGL